MAQAGKDVSPAGGAVRYECHRPETTVLYRLVDEHYPAFADRLFLAGVYVTETPGGGVDPYGESSKHMPLRIPKRRLALHKPGDLAPT
ncbi:MAG: hypothetical protein OES26_23530 [Gammaproteobacteria bacterium]|nr:hypothetical protein [Gammaproteobacteria bacterium]